ncbi:MAG: hypothetical protein MUC34_04220 [Anaerolineae bacterium]|nr:hypothetical protein [Anaerolineae bacterium]
MRHVMSRSVLMGALLIVVMIASACATLPPLTGGEQNPMSTEAPAVSPTVTPPVTSGGSPAVEAARQTLAQELGVPVESVRVVSVQEVEWPNGCLGVQKPDMMCTDAIVPGYQVILEVEGKQYEVRTDLTGRQAVVAPEGSSGPAGSAPPAAELARAQAAADLGVELSQVTIVSVEPVEWPDACLGMPDPTELCAQMITPGYRVTLDVNGKPVIYRTNETGEEIRLERQPQSPEEFPPAAQAAREALARDLGAPVNTINIQLVEKAEWPDSCLGLGGPAESCLQSITPGYRVTLEYNGQQYVYRTDESGENVRAEAASATSGETAAGAAGESEPVIGLRRDVDGTCQDVRVDLLGVSFGDCGMEMATASFLPDAFRREQLEDMQKTFASFGVSTPSGKVTFVGKGPVEATAVEQRMVAEWANAVAQEAQEGAAAGYGMGWLRQGGIAGFCDEVSVDASGHATLRSCKNETVAPTWKRLTTDELTKFYGWLDRLGAAEAEVKDPATADAMTVSLVFSGRGTQQAVEADTSAMMQFGAELLQQWAESTPVRYITTSAEVNIRKGPSEQFAVIEKIAAGQQALVTGVNRESAWWRVVCPDNTAGNCWVTGDTQYTQPVTPAGSTGLATAGEGQEAIDETAILAAVVRQVYTMDDTFGGNGKFPVIYLLAVGDDEQGAIPYNSPARPVAAPVQQSVVASLSDLPAQFKWVTTAGEVKRDKQGVVEGKGAIITLGNIQPQADGAVQVKASIYVAPMAAGGQTYVLQREGDTWIVTGKVGPSWIS